MIGDLLDKPWMLLILAVMFIVLFGSRKLPDAARSLGRSMRILKSEVKGLHDDDDDRAESSATVQAAPAQLQAAPPESARVDAQAQIDALQRQLSELQRQQTAGANGVAQADAQQSK